MGHISSADIMNIICDATAGVFLVILIISITLQPAKRGGAAHLLASAILVLAATFLQINAALAEMLPESFDWIAGVRVITPALLTAIRIMSYAFGTVGISESVTHVIYVNEDNNKSGLRRRYVICAVFIVAGAAAYVLLGNNKVFPLLILAQFGYYWLYLLKNWSDSTRWKYIRASLVAVITFAFALAVGQVRLMGLGLAVMLVILGEQYHNHLAMELVKSESALAKNRVQLLADQISPHYIFNSLQSISSLCDSDPTGAKEAIDYFSEYLRGNLESLTAEELIPFTRELEHTKAYLELERLSGSINFAVEYILEVTDFMLPPLVLQPVVENAVRHGSAGADPDAGDDGKTVITIGTRESGGKIYIEVTDRTNRSKGSKSERNATGNSGHEVSGTGKKKSVGLENVRTRLAIQCGGTLEMTGGDGGAKVTIRLPRQGTARSQ